MLEAKKKESEEEIQKITSDLNKVKGLLFEQELRESGILKKVIRIRFGIFKKVIQDFLNSVYFKLRFGLANSINTYLRLKFVLGVAGP